MQNFDENVRRPFSALDRALSLKQHFLKSEETFLKNETMIIWVHILKVRILEQIFAGLWQFKIPAANLIKIKVKKIATWSAWSQIDHIVSYLTPRPGPLHPASSPWPLLDTS